MANNYVFIHSEIALLVEALSRASKRLEALATWHFNEGNTHLSTKHGTKAAAMRTLIKKLQPVTGLQGEVR